MLCVTFVSPLDDRVTRMGHPVAGLRAIMYLYKDATGALKPLELLLSSLGLLRWLSPCEHTRISVSSSPFAVVVVDL